MVLVQVFATISAVGVAWLGLRGKLLEIKKTSAATQAASEKVESSINNRDSPASDRWDAIHADVTAIIKVNAENTKALTAITAKQREQSRDLRGIRADNESTRRDIGELRQADRSTRQDLLDVREDLGQHIQAASGQARMLNDLHAIVVQGKPPENGSDGNG